MKRVALLGCGVVGRRVAERLESERDRLAEAIGESIELSVVLVRDTARDRGLSRARLTSCLREVVDDPALDAAIEVLGGVDPAFPILERLLRRGVPVVTANKSVVAHHWDALHSAARASGSALRFEASVGGAMPIVRALRSLAGDRIERVRAVLSGSCNFVLERIRRDGWSLERSIAAARDCGLLEPDPSADLSGRDAAEKLSIVSALAGRRIEPGAVDVTGIDRLRPEDLAATALDGRRWRLVAEWSRERAFVAPRLLPQDDPLFEVPDAENAAVIDARDSGRIVIQGRGAGPAPTAATVLGDLIESLDGSGVEGAAAAACLR